MNAQGFANAILFCNLTEPVRRRLNTFHQAILKLASCSKCARHDGGYDEDLLLSTSVNEDKLQDSCSSTNYNSITT